MPLSGMLTCGSCGTRTQMNTMRYNLSGNKLICPDCIDKERSGIKPGTTQAGSSARLQRAKAVHAEIQSNSAPTLRMAQTNAPTEVHHAAPAGSMVNYYCKTCHYKFSRKREIDISSCPYCGRDNIGVAYEGRAQDLIEQSTNNESFF